MQQQQKKRIAIFGSTGSIGTQALDVIEANPDLFEVEILTAHTNDELLVKQALQFNPNAVVIVDEKKLNVQISHNEYAIFERGNLDHVNIVIENIIFFIDSIICFCRKIIEVKLRTT